MKRCLICLWVATLVVVAGCGRSYDTRMEATVNHLKYLDRLKKNLEEPAADPFKKESIYLRVPKGLELSKAFPLGETQGVFDVAASFFDSQKQNNGLRLHVVARNEKPKKAPAKGAPAAAPADTANRGPFDQDLIRLLETGYGVSDALASPVWKNESKRSNSYRRMVFTSSTNGNTIEVYVLKQKPYDVALIWDIPAALSRKDSSIETGKPLSLECFAVGQKANRAFNSQGGDEGGGPGGEGPPPAPF